MTREELDFIGSMNMCDEISNEAYKKIVCHCEGQEPCEDAISRQAAIEAMYKMHMNGKEGVLHDLKTEIGSDAIFVETIADAVEALEELPPVNPQPKGYWITDSRHFFICSECDNSTDVCSNFCPNCGARMVESQESEEQE